MNLNLCFMVESRSSRPGSGCSLRRAQRRIRAPRTKGRFTPSIFAVRQRSAAVLRRQGACQALDPGADHLVVRVFQESDVVIPAASHVTGAGHAAFAELGGPVAVHRQDFLLPSAGSQTYLSADMSSRPSENYLDGPFEVQERYVPRYHQDPRAFRLATPQYDPDSACVVHALTDLRNMDTPLSPVCPLAS